MTLARALSSTRRIHVFKRLSLFLNVNAPCIIHATLRNHQLFLTLRYTDSKACFAGVSVFCAFDEVELHWREVNSSKLWPEGSVKKWLHERLSMQIPDKMKEQQRVYEALKENKPSCQLQA